MASKMDDDYPTEYRKSHRTQTSLEPGPVAHFRGSIILNNLPPIPDSAAPTVRHKKVPDWVAYFRAGWTDVGVWKSAFVEMVATGLLCYLSGLIDTTIGNFGTSQGAAYAGLTNIFLLTLFIMAAGPGSGGHVNPTITFATLISGLTSFSRGILYLIGQLVGAAVAGGVLRGSFGKARSIAVHGGGCFRDHGSVTAGQALLIEIFSVFALLFLAFGVALDPRQQKLFGMFAAPLAVGCSVGLVAFASGGIAPGYTGASLHPGRCFAFAVARSNFADQWIWWLGPVIGSILHMITFRVAPPYHSTTVPSEA